MKGQCGHKATSCVLFMSLCVLTYFDPLRPQFVLKVKTGNILLIANTRKRASDVNNCWQGP